MLSMVQLPITIDFVVVYIDHRLLLLHGRGCTCDMDGVEWNRIIFKSCD